MSSFAQSRVGGISTDVESQFTDVIFHAYDLVRLASLPPHEFREILTSTPVASFNSSSSTLPSSSSSFNPDGLDFLIPFGLYASSPKSIRWLEEHDPFWLDSCVYYRWFQFRGSPPSLRWALLRSGSMRVVGRGYLRVVSGTLSEKKTATIEANQILFDVFSPIRSFESKQRTKVVESSLRRNRSLRRR